VDQANLGNPLCPFGDEWEAAKNMHTAELPSQTDHESNRHETVVSRVSD
jgi:hypothetical protein